MPNSDSGLQVTERDGVLRVTLNRPARRNALSQSLVAELSAALDRVSRDPSIRVVVLGATGVFFVPVTIFRK